MPILTVRPNGDAYVLNATRTPAGTPLSNSQDNVTALLTEYVSFSNGAPDGRGEYIAHMAGETLTFTSAQRIRAVRARVDMQNVSDPGKSVYGTLLIRDPAYGDTPKDWLSSTVAGSIVQRSGRWNTVHPSGGIWGSGGVGRAQVRFAPYRPPSGVYARIHGLYLDVHVKDQPTITPLSVSATNTTRPTVAGTWATTEGDALNRIRTKVFTPTQVATAGFNPETSRALWDSGDRATTQAVQNIGTDLLAGISYTAYLKAAYLVNGVPFWSAWGSAAVALSTEPPSASTLSITLDTVLRRVLLAYQGRVNLLPDANDADFEGGPGNYTTGVGITSVARSTAQARHGVGSLAVTYNGTANPFTANDGNGAVGLIPVKRGQQFRMSGYARANTTGRSQRLVMRWYNTTPAYDSQTDGTNVTDVTTGWTAFPDVTGTAPVDGYLAIQIQGAATPAAGEIHFYDQFQVVSGTTVVAWSPGGLVGTALHTVERWDRSYGQENLAREELARCTEGLSVRTAADQLADAIDWSGAGGVSKRWRPTATSSILDFGIPGGGFLEEFALPGVGGMVAVASFWARASAAGTYQLGIDSHDGIGTGITGAQTSVSLTTSLQRFSYGRTLEAGAAHCKAFLINGTGTTGQDVWVSGFQWELRPAGSGTVPDIWVPGQGIGPDWQGVRFANEQVLDSAEAINVSDFEVAPGIVRTYRASANVVLTGLTENLSSPYTSTNTGAVWLAPTGTWILKDPYSPDRNAAVRVVGLGEGIDPSVAIFQPAGAELPVGFTDFVGGMGNGQVTVIALGDHEWAFMRSLLRSGNILLLDLPEGGHRYLAIRQANWPRAGPLGQIQRAVNLDVVEVSAPPDLG